MDDEYAWCGVEDPKIVVTTSHNPSSRLKQFAKVGRWRWGRGGGGRGGGWVWEVEVGRWGIWVTSWAGGRCTLDSLIKASMDLMIMSCDCASGGHVT